MEEYSKYPVEVISGIAEETGMGMVCFLNPDTLETESVPGASYGSYECGDFDKYYQEVTGRWSVGRTASALTRRSWESPSGSWSVSFGIAYRMMPE